MVKISVVTPCYNDGRYLLEAVDSVSPLRETGVCEHIIVDDGSTDPETLSLYTKLERNGLEILYPGKVGLGAARNIGIKYSKAPYYLNLDADNRIRPHFPELAARILDEQPRVGIVYGDAQFFGAEDKVYKPGPFNRDRLLRHNFIDTCSVVRRMVWDETGGYDQQEMVWEDWNFWLGVLNTQWQFYYVEDILYDYRKRKEGSLNSASLVRGDEVEGYIASKYGLTYRKAFLTVLTDLENKEREWQNENLKLRSQLKDVMVNLEDAKEEIMDLVRRSTEWKNENLKLNEQLKKKHLQLDDARKEIHDLENTGRERENENIKLQEKLNQVYRRLEATDKDLLAVHNSRSWKLTAPVRSIFSLFDR